FHFCSTAPPAPGTSTLSLHDALPIFPGHADRPARRGASPARRARRPHVRLGRQGTSLHLEPRQSVSAAAQARSGSAVLPGVFPEDRKSTRLNSSHVKISYAVFCLKKK